MHQHNLHEIYALNQRGGPALSLLDLVDANTVDLPVASLLAGAVASGASLLTAARPGNAGKTTVMAALLAFLPPDRHILTARSAAALAHVSPGTCLLAAEIGSGRIPGYLWGDEARRFFEVGTGPGVSAASNLHADTLEEVRSVLCGQAIGLGAGAFGRIDLLAFLRLDRLDSGCRRRVCAVYAATGAPGSDSHERVCRWDEATDTFTVERIPERWADATERISTFLTGARRQRATGFEQLVGLLAKARGESALPPR